jgi:pyridoxamine 5'-phosphate oxidase
MDTLAGRLVVDVPQIDRRVDPVQSDVPWEDPAALAAAWLPGEGEERMLMTLATVDAEGFPRSRTVMLSEFDGERFFFHTDAASRKVVDLAANPKVSLAMLWPGFSRQIIVQGTAEVAPAEEVARAYAARSPYLRQLAWMNTAEFAALPLAEREARWAAFAQQHPEPAQPEGWVGYAVTPHRLMFWVSHPESASRRVEFTRGGSGAGWARRYLPG